jgi:hypothetical protein
MIAKTRNRKPETFKAVARYKWAIAITFIIVACLLFSNWNAALGWFVALCAEMEKQTAREKLTDALQKIADSHVPAADTDPYELQSACYNSRSLARAAIGMEDS